MANVERRAHVEWEGDLANGSGRLTEEDSGGLSEAPVASAHATCYAMALSNTLAEQGSPPDRLTVDAVCTLDDEQLKITTVELNVRGQVSGISDEDFQNATQEADQICPVTNALRGNVEVRVNAS